MTLELSKIQWAGLIVIALLVCAAIATGIYFAVRKKKVKEIVRASSQPLVVSMEPTVSVSTKPSEP